MPILQVSPDLEMHYVVDDFTDPWHNAEAVLLLHGNAESGVVWASWVPYLARHYRVVRPDMRGFGESTPMPRDFVWTPDGLVDDYISLMNSLGIERFHLVGAKISQVVARRCAVRFPGRIQSLTLVGTLLSNDAKDAALTAARIEEYEKHGLGPWARRTATMRLGDEFPPEGVDWWVNLMARTSVSTEVGLLKSCLKWDITSDFPQITCQTLLITDEGRVGGSSIEETRTWQRKIPNSRLLELPTTGRHVAACDADRCARETFDFISSLGANKG